MLLSQRVSLGPACQALPARRAFPKNTSNVTGRPAIHQHASSLSSTATRCPSALRTRMVAAAAAAPSASQSASQEGYDVYVAEPEPLKKGEEKHVISVFVADEAGLINRVAGVFARRGANIESLAVGLTTDKALFTIVVTGTSGTVANLVKQLGKLVKVRYVEDVTKSTRVERELMLIKLGAPAGPDRTEVMQLAEIFRASIVDVSDRFLTLCVSGDPGKCLAVQKVMQKFGITEVVRTGRIALKRGDQLLEAGQDWIRNAPEGTYSNRDAIPTERPRSGEGRDADVYAVDEEGSRGVWEANNLLEAYSENTSGPEDFVLHTLSIEVCDVPGVLNQVTGVFARRGYNVMSLAVGPCEKSGNSRITMVVPGNQRGISSLIKQVYKLASVLSVTNLTEEPFASRELMLIKVRCDASQRGELRDLVDIFRGGIVDVSPTTLTVEVQGKNDKMKALYDLLEPYGIMEVARTGRIALLRGSGVDTAFLEKMQAARVW